MLVFLVVFFFNLICFESKESTSKRKRFIFFYFEETKMLAKHTKGGVASDLEMGKRRSERRGKKNFFITLIVLRNYFEQTKI